MLPDVNLTATNVATGVSRSTVTTKDGTYQFPQLQIGTYIPKAEKSGFTTFTTTQFHLDVAQIYVQNTKLAIGAVSKEITVQANGVQHARERLADFRYHTFQTGFPITLSNQVNGLFGNSSGTCPGAPVGTVSVSCWDTVNVNGPVMEENPRAAGNLWFNPLSFSQACAPVLLAELPQNQPSFCVGATPITNPETGGNAGRNFFHGPGLQQWDFQLTKGFQFRENLRMELRAELYNIFNHANFANPDGNFADGASSFGVIGAIQGLPREVQLAAKFYF